MAAERSGGRRRRVLGLFVAVAALVAADQVGVLGDVFAGRPAPVRIPAAAATVAPRSSSLDGGFEALAARLRMPGAASAVDAPAVEPPPAAPAATPSEVAIAPPPGAFDRAELASTVLAPPPRALRASRYDSSVAAGGTWALLIGINDYPGLRYDLRSAVNDVNDVDAALAQLGVTNDRRLVLRDTQAGADTIRAAVDWLTAHAGADSTMVLFFAGHVQQLAPGQEALVGADGATVADDELAALLDRSPARREWNGIAGCYSGGFTEVVRPGRILTAAAPADRVAYENSTFGRSYLVEYMVRRAMLQRGMTTVEGAFAWAVSELQREYPDRAPVEVDDLDGDLDLKVPPPPPPSSGGSPASGGPSSPAPPPAPTYDPQTPPPPKADDGCANLTVGVVRCN
jgi:hypothetical protein